MLIGWNPRLLARNGFHRIDAEALDLDFGDVAVDTARGTRFEKGRARYLVLVSVAHGGADLDENFDYDREAYTEMS